MATRGQKRHLVTLENPTRVTDGEGYTETWAALVPSQVFAEIKPATARDLERTVANVVSSTASHLITIDYHSGVTSQTRVTKGPRNTDGTLPTGSREFKVTGIQNPEERNIDLILAAEEVVA